MPAVSATVSRSSTISTVSVPWRSAARTRLSVLPRSGSVRNVASAPGVGEARRRTNNSHNQCLLAPSVQATDHSPFPAPGLCKSVASICRLLFRSRLGVVTALGSSKRNTLACSPYLSPDNAGARAPDRYLAYGREAAVAQVCKGQPGMKPSGWNAPTAVMSVIAEIGRSPLSSRRCHPPR